MLLAAAAVRGGQTLVTLLRHFIESNTPVGIHMVSSSPQRAGRKSKLLKTLFVVQLTVGLKWT